jgi:hypothetical protein
MEIEFADLQMTIPDGWVDVTEDCDEGCPPTLTAGDEGLGALQFSVATYESGAKPGIGLKDVEELLRDFAEKNGLNAARAFQARESPPLVSGDFEYEDGFLRAWYVSDGESVAFVTYTCGESSGSQFEAELAAADGIVSSIRFPPSA